MSIKKTIVNNDIFVSNKNSLIETKSSSQSFGIKCSKSKFTIQFNGVALKWFISLFQKGTRLLNKHIEHQKYPRSYAIIFFQPRKCTLSIFQFFAEYQKNCKIRLEVSIGFLLSWLEFCKSTVGKKIRKHLLTKRVTVFSTESPVFMQTNRLFWAFLSETGITKRNTSFVFAGDFITRISYSCFTIRASFIVMHRKRQSISS